MKAFYLKNFRNGLATNSSSTHSVIYRNEGEMFDDLDIFELDYYGRCDSTIAATREAKIKYVLANIMYDNALVKALLPKYPEMKQYFGLIKKKMNANSENDWYGDESFGMCCRGELTTGNLEYDVDYLIEVIENPEIIIVGGSDEMDFVYDTTDGHDEVVMPVDYRTANHDYLRRGNANSAVHKNGNYWVGYGSSHLHRVVKLEDHYDFENYKRNCTLGRVRFTSTKGPLVPEYPELIDLRLTNKCNHGCPFCFMDSTNKEPHMDERYINRILNGCGPRTEFSIGGGNILLYPELEYVLAKIKSEGHIVNVTINAKDCDTIVNDEKIKDIFIKFVDGIGISVASVEDLKEVKKVTALYKDYDFFSKHPGYHSKYVTIHMIPEYLGVETTKQIVEATKQNGLWIPSLFLGYKENGRGAKCEHKVFTESELNEIFSDYNMIAIDTSFANTYYDYLDKTFAIRKCITLNEGEYSLYVDGVNEVMYKSSYQLDKPYRLYEYSEKEINKNPFKKNAIEVRNIKTAFEKIREDNGLPAYNYEDDMYYKDAEVPYYENEDE